MSSSPQAIRRPVLTAPRRIELRTYPRPVPGRGEVLVRNLVNAICGSEFPAYLGIATVHPIHLGIADYPVDLAGHESAGVVEEVGPGVTGFAAGDLVVGDIWQGYSERCVVRARDLVAFDPELPPQVAAMSTMVSETGYAVRQMFRQAARGPFLVVGLGAAGLLIVQHLVRADRGPVAGIDPIEDRARLGAELGARTQTDPGGIEGKAYGTVIETSGTLEGTDLAFFAVADAGTVGLFGRPRESQKVLLEEIFHRRLQVLAQRAPGPAYGPRSRAAALEEIRSGAIDVLPLLGPEYPLEEIERAFEAAAIDQVAPRVLVRVT